MTKVLVFFFLFSTLQALNVQQYSRSNSLTFEMLEDARLENSHVFSDFNTLITLGMSYVDEPLVVKSANNSQQLEKIISGMTNFHFGGAWYPKDWLQLGTSLNYSLFENNLGQSFSDLSDIELRIKTRIFNSKRHAISLMPVYSIGLNGGNTDIIDSNGFNFGKDTVLSDGGDGYGFRLIYETVLRSIQIVSNVGFIWSPEAFFKDSLNNIQIDMRERLITGVGVYYPAFEKVGFNFEILRTWSSPLFNDDINPTEFHIGASTGLSRKFHGFVGVNFGNLLSGADGNDYRVIAGIKLTPTLDYEKIYKRTGTKKAKSIKIIKEKDIVEKVIVTNQVCSAAPLFGNENTIRVVFPNDKFDLSEQQKESLRNVAQQFIYRADDIKSIDLQGHASPVSTKDYNLKLSHNRALEVRQFLIDQDPNAVFSHFLKDYQFFGEDKPLLKGRASQKEHKINRRVDITVHLKTCSLEQDQ